MTHHEKGAAVIVTFKNTTNSEHDKAQESRGGSRYITRSDSTLTGKGERLSHGAGGRASRLVPVNSSKNNALAEMRELMLQVLSPMVAALRSELARELPTLPSSRFKASVNRLKMQVAKYERAYPSFDDMLSQSLKDSQHSKPGFKGAAALDRARTPVEEQVAHNLLLSLLAKVIDLLEALQSKSTQLIKSGVTSESKRMNKKSSALRFGRGKGETAKSPEFNQELIENLIPILVKLLDAANRSPAILVSQ